VGGLFTAGLAYLGNSFAPLCAIEAGIARVEHQSELLKAAPPAEALAVIGLEIGMPEVGAPAAIARLALPMSGLEPAFEAFSGAIKKQQVVTEPVSLVGHVLDSAVEVSLRFGPAPVPARELVALRPGQVIRLGQSSSASLSLEVESVPFLAARPGRVGRRLACVIVDPATEPGVTPS
jgi:flagellar motor switch protein FliM